MRRYVKEICLPNDAQHFHEENDHQTYRPVILILLDGFQVPAGSSSMIGDLMCTGLTTWRVADLTAAFIASHHKDFSRKHVLELGCGLGLCGILAGHLVGSEGSVLMTDGDEEVLSLCNKNILLNNECLNTSTELLRWDNQTKAKHIIDARGGTGFDVIIGADCLYGRDPNIVEHLFACASIMLRNKDNLLSAVECSNSFSEPSLILGYERRVGGGDIASVFETAAKHGFDWSLGDDAILDMFGNVTSELTMFWEQAVFVFTKRRNIF